MSNRITARRMVATVLGAACVAVLATACTGPLPASGNRLLIVGDSLTDGSRGTISAALRDAGWDLTIQAVGGTTIEDWAGRLPKIVAFTRPDVVVIELGTNDCASKGCPDLAPVIDQAMRALADKIVLWVNIQDDAIQPLHADYVNYAISQADARWPNMFPVDLAVRMHGHPEWRSDGLHFNAAGKQQYASLLVEALQPFAPAH